MRSLKDNQALTPIEVSASFPDGAIINEAPNTEGTAVVREVYNDPLVNLYKLMRMVGVIPNGIEDSELNGYQLIAAFQRLCNIQNDIVQTMSLVGSVYAINLPIELLPNKYFIFAKTSDGYTDGGTYTFKGAGALSYSLTSPTGFNSGDLVLLILDQFGVLAYSINGSSANSSSGIQFTVFGAPLAYNDSDKLWYQSEGVLYSDLPDVYDLQAAVRLASGDATMLVYEIICIGARIVCMVYSEDTSLYQLYGFTTSNLSTPPVTIGSSLGDGTDRQPFIFYNGVNLFITNSSGNSSSDGLIDIYTINLTANTISNVGSTTLSSYIKSTNTVIVNGYLYSFISGTITQYNLSTGAKVVGPAFPGPIGIIFVYSGDVYYSSGDVAKKWALQVY